jgi:hypothetical protein
MPEGRLTMQVPAPWAALIHGPSRWPEEFRLQVTLDDDIGNL